MSLVSLAGVGLAFLVSASVSSFAMANILIALPFVFMMVRRRDTRRIHTAEIIILHALLWLYYIFTGLYRSLSSSHFQVFGGFLVDLNGMLSWLSWLKWISIFRYGLNVRY